MANNKHNQLKRQYSLDGGLTWQDLSPMVYKVGNITETNSSCTDKDGCRWRILPLTVDFDCDNNYNMYQVEIEECLNDDGVFVPSGERRRYQLIETYSTACGYTGPFCTPSTRDEYSYTIEYNGGAVEYDQYATPVVYQITTTIETDKGCREIRTTKTKQIEDYSITYSPDGYNYTEEERTVTATVSYSGSVIGSFDYIQKNKSNSTVTPFEKTKMYSSDITPHTYATPIEDYNNWKANAFSTMINNTLIWTRDFIIDLTNGNIIKNYDIESIGTSTVFKSDGTYFTRSPYDRPLFSTARLNASNDIYYHNGNEYIHITSTNGGSSFIFQNYMLILNAIDDDPSDNYLPDGYPMVQYDKYTVIDDINAFITTDFGNYGFGVNKNISFIDQEYLGNGVFENQRFKYNGVEYEFDNLENFENRYLFISEYNKLYIYDIINDELMTFTTNIPTIICNIFCYLEENIIGVQIAEDSNTTKKGLIFNTETKEIKLLDECYWLKNNIGIFHEDTILFYSELNDVYFDFDKVYFKSGGTKTHNIDFRTKYNCNYFIMNAQGVVRFFTDTSDYRLLIGYTNSKEVTQYFDLNYESGLIKNQINLEFEGETFTYRLNSNWYTATTTPYIVTYDDIGFNNILTSLSFGTNLTTLNRLPDTSNVTNMSEMFDDCSSLTTLNTSNWNTSNVTDMSYMFNGCSSLTSLNLNGFDMNKVTKMNYMFNNCSNVRNISLSNLVSNNQIDMSYMFNNCTTLTSLDLSGWNVACSTSFMFQNCSNLTSIDINNWIMTNNCSGMFRLCTNLQTVKITNSNIFNNPNISSMFYMCTNLTTVDLSGTSIAYNTNVNGMFNSCDNLTTIYCYGCDQTTIDKLNSVKPSSCTLVY